MSVDAGFTRGIRGISPRLVHLGQEASAVGPQGASASPDGVRHRPERTLVVFRWLLVAAARTLLFVGLAMLTGGCPTPERVEENATTSPTSAEVWTCPMHPAVRLGAPGSCPICGMDLVAATGDGGVTVDAAHRAELGVVVEPAVLRELYSVTTLPGVVAWDTTRLAEVSARVDARLDRVHVRVGQRVARGDVLFTVSGLEIAATLAERGRAEPAATAPGDVNPEPTRGGLDRSAMEARLTAWGLVLGPDGAATVRAPSSGVVLELGALAGATVANGTVLARIADPRARTVEAWLAEAAPVPTEARVVLGGLSLPARVLAAEPAVDPATRSRRIVFAVDGLELPAGAYVGVDVDGAGGEQVCVPADAVVYTGPRRVVYVDDGARLVPRTVEVGARDDGWVAITSGLAVGERVVTDGVFLIAADSRLRAVTP